MIPRYSPQDLAELWSDAHRIGAWLDVELAAVEAMTEAGRVPAADLAHLRSVAASADRAALSKRALEIEESTKHDVIAFLTAFEELAGPASRHVHFGLTSSDVVDTAFALSLVQAAKILEHDLEELRAAVWVRVEEHKRTPMVGRTHGIHAEPITFGLVLASWYAELGRGLERLKRAKEEIRVGKLSGAVGTSAHLDPAIEARALAKLGLEVEPVATQVVARDRHATFFTTLAVIASSLERIAVEIRHLQRTEVHEAEEPFEKGQKGSSAMPHKRNPILAENVTGLARLVRSYAVAALEDVALWHERDISHSSVERVIAPDATCALGFMLRRLRKIVEGLAVYPAHMLANLERMKGLVHSQSVLLRLAEKGLKRQDAYAIVQRAAMRVWAEGVPFKAALLEDAELRAQLTTEELDRCFDLAHDLRNVPTIIARATQE
jgi:adenylosuccinate lyase